MTRVPNKITITSRGILINDVREVLLSSEDLQWVSSMRVYFNKLYARTNVNRKSRLLHRLIMERSLGRPLLPREYIDHIDGNGFNDRRDNLRLATQFQNLCNHSGHSDRKAPYKGLCTMPKGIFIVKIYRRYTDIYIGSYSDADEAAWMYDQWSIALDGEFSKTNFAYE